MTRYVILHQDAHKHCLELFGEEEKKTLTYFVEPILNAIFH